MKIKIIERLEDLEGIRKDEFVKVLAEDESRLIQPKGIVYDVGKDRFSIIEFIYILKVENSLYKVNYNWDSSKKVFIASLDENQPFEKNFQQYKEYESLLNQNLNQMIA